MVADDPGLGEVVRCGAGPCRPVGDRIPSAFIPPPLAPSGRTRWWNSRCTRHGRTEWLAGPCGPSPRTRSRRSGPPLRPSQISACRRAKPSGSPPCAVLKTMRTPIASMSSSLRERWRKGRRLGRVSRRAARRRAGRASRRRRGRHSRRGRAGCAWLGRNCLRCESGVVPTAGRLSMRRDRCALDDGDILLDVDGEGRWRGAAPVCGRVADGRLPSQVRMRASLRR